METILGTITLPATRPGYRLQCGNSGRTLIRLLVAEANASSPSAGLAIESMMESLLPKGLTEVSLTEFNALRQHAFTRLNRSLPAHAQLGNPLIAEKLCALVRRVSESVCTPLDVKLVMKGATGVLNLTLATIRKVLHCKITSSVKEHVTCEALVRYGYKILLRYSSSNVISYKLVTALLGCN
eukprot:3789014-Pleurochrysis_carterae.AAC.1